MDLCEKKQKHYLSKALEVGDCWMAMALANNSGLILTYRVGKHTDSLWDALMSSTQGKTNCKNWNHEDWGGYERILAPGLSHYIGKDRAQRLEHTNRIVQAYFLIIRTP